MLNDCSKLDTKTKNRLFNTLGEIEKLITTSFIKEEWIFQESPDV